MRTPQPTCSSQLSACPQRWPWSTWALEVTLGHSWPRSDPDSQRASLLCSLHMWRCQDGVFIWSRLALAWAGIRRCQCRGEAHSEGRASPWGCTGRSGAISESPSHPPGLGFPGLAFHVMVLPVLCAGKCQRECFCLESPALLGSHWPAATSLSSAFTRYLALDLEMPPWVMQPGSPIARREDGRRHLAAQILSSQGVAIVTNGLFFM